MNDWKPYLNDRVIKECNGFYIIKPSQEKSVVPLSCPVCNYLFRTFDDEKSYRDFECCESCETHWARPNLTKWRQGWRPDKCDVLKKASERKKITVNIHV
jgi:hypothetical protein